MHCFFVSDLHGHRGRYRRLVERIAAERPDLVLLGGDLLPGGWLLDAGGEEDDFLRGFLLPALAELRGRLGASYPQVGFILGNDDPAAALAEFAAGEQAGLWRHLHMAALEIQEFTVLGYACVPPTPFGLKDWERYDVSRHVDPGCVSPEEGVRTVPADPREVRWGTIARDLDTLAAGRDPARTVLLCHAPPYRTALDRAALDGRAVDHVPLDVHVGSVALRRFIENRQPLSTLHGHIHESARLTGRWLDRLGATVMISAAHDGPELALVRLDLRDPASATRELLPAE